MFQIPLFQTSLLVAAMTLAASAALAATERPVTVKVNGATLLAGPAVRSLGAPPAREPGLVPIFNNLLPVKKYPYGTYFCCLGPTIAGPDNQYGVTEQWWAEAFTPNANATVITIEVGVGYSVGTNSVNVGLYSDANGVPGMPLVSRDVDNLPDFCSCCVTMTLKDKNGVQVTAGTQYWVVLSTDSSDTNFLGGWNYNTSDQVTKTNQAENFGSGWQAGAIAPGVALAVWGR